MFSPAGYTSIFNLQNVCGASREGRLGRRWLKQSWFHNALMTGGNLFASSVDGAVVKVPIQVLTRLRVEYAFVDTKSWSISLRKLWEAADDFSDNRLRLGMYILQDSFDNYPGPEVAEGLSRYEGWNLIVLDNDASDIVSRFCLAGNDYLADTVPKNPMSPAEARREWGEWTKSFSPPDKPNKKAREDWGSARGISRDQVREFQRAHSPEYWTRPGNTSGKS